MPPTTDTRPSLTPSVIGKLINLNNCERYFKLRVHEDGFDHFAHRTSDYVEAFHMGNIVERKTGEDFEQRIKDKLENHSTDFIDFTDLSLADIARRLPNETQQTLPTQIDSTSFQSGDFSIDGVQATEINAYERGENASTDPTEPTPDEETVSELDSNLFQLRVAYTKATIADILSHVGERPLDLDTNVPVESGHNKTTPSQTTRAPSDPIILYQPTFSGTIGTWHVAGDADLIFIWPGPDGSVYIRVVDVKVASEQRAHHQIQTTAYAQLIRDLQPVAQSNQQISIQGGVLTPQKESYIPPTPQRIPEFPLENRITDLNQLLKTDGTFDNLHNIVQFDDADYQLDSSCSRCKFNEACYTDAVENKNIELLGINTGTQRRLTEHGITSLEDLAKLAQPLSDDTLAPEETPQPGPSPSDETTYNELACIPGIGERLPHLIQQAQALLGSVEPTNQYAHGNSDAPHLSDVSYGDLPDDSHNDFYDYKPGSLIRVYLNVQHDHLRDTIIAISATVTATASETPPQQIAHTSGSVPMDQFEIAKEEQTLLATFASDLLNGIQKVGEGISFDDYPSQSDPFLHFFTYTEGEKELIQKSLAEHTTGEAAPVNHQHQSGKSTTEDSTEANSPTSSQPSQQTTLGEELPSDSDENAREPEFELANGGSPQQTVPDGFDKLLALQTLLGMRENADQPMVSAVQPDIESRMALKAPTTGIVNIYDQFYPQYRPDERKAHSSWTYSPKDPSRLPPDETEFNLRQVFNYRLFNNYVPYRETGDGVEFLYDKDLSQADIDSRYPIRVRSGAQIPLAYIWSAIGAIDNDWVKDAKERHTRTVIDPFRFHNSNEKERPITTEDLNHLMLNLTEALQHIEQGIPIKSQLRPPKEEDDT